MLPADGAPQAFSAPPVALLDEPIAYILATHDVHRHVCASLQEIGRSGLLTVALADALRPFLHDEIAIHYRDEEEALFPVLQRRALPVDELPQVLERLQKDHIRANDMLKRIQDFLETAKGEDTMVPMTMSAVLLRYAAQEQRHLAIENAIVMTMAQVRLTKPDLATISQRMKQHRGLAG